MHSHVVVAAAVVVVVVLYTFQAEELDRVAQQELHCWVHRAVQHNRDTDRSHDLYVCMTMYVCMYVCGVPQ